MAQYSAMTRHIEPAADVAEGCAGAQAEAAAAAEGSVARRLRRMPQPVPFPRRARDIAGRSDRKVPPFCAHAAACSSRRRRHQFFSALRMYRNAYLKHAYRHLPLFSARLPVSRQGNGRRTVTVTQKCLKLSHFYASRQKAYITLFVISPLPRMFKDSRRRGMRRRRARRADDARACCHAKDDEALRVT